MDDTTFHIPSQPDNNEHDDRPEGADSAADIARSKLNAIYGKQQPAQPEPVQTPAATPTFQPSQSPAVQSNPANPEPINQQPPTPSGQQSSYQPTQQLEPQTEPEPDWQYEQPTPQPSAPTPAYDAETRTLYPAASASPSYEPTPPAAVYEPAQPTSQPQSYQPETQPEPVQPQPSIIQPIPAQSPVDDDIPTFHAPGTVNHPPVSSYVPAQQYAQEVSLEDQIDGLRHTAPDHQLPVQAQKEVKKSWIPYNFQPLLRTLTLAVVIAVIYNHQFLVGQVQSYINPAQSVVSPTIIAPNTGENISNENKLIIPKINVDIPVVYDVATFEESAVQAGLERGVVHYGTTALPGENGNNVIVGHSSNNFWNNGEYKFAFVLLNKLNEGDTFTLHYEGTAYTYEVFRRKIVPPTAVDVIFEDFGEPVVTLITCDPPGTSWNRLIVNARQISPDPDSATKPQSSDRPNEVISVPSDSSSLLQNLFD